MLLWLGLIPILGVQGQSDDNRIWTSFTINKELTSNFDLEFEQHFRFEGLQSEPYSYISEMAVSNDLFSNWRAGGGYRYFRSKGDPGSRIFLYLRYRPDIGDLKLDYRAMATLEYVRDGDREQCLRHRINCRYPLLSWLEPYLRGELFLPITDEGIRADRLRRDIGLRFHITNDQMIKFFYREQSEIYTDDPDTEYILGLGYALDL